MAEKSATDLDNVIMIPREHYEACQPFAFDFGECCTYKSFLNSYSSLNESLLLPLINAVSGSSLVKLVYKSKDDVRHFRVRLGVVR